VFGYTQIAMLKRSKYLPHLTSCDCRVSGTKRSSGLQLQITANKMQLFLNLFIFTDTLHVSGGFLFAVICNYIKMHGHMNIKKVLRAVPF
jgi:hypothetical protein